MTYTCPVCGYQNLPFPPLDYEICPSCGTEFEYHDARRTHAELRRMWVREGALWHSRVIPKPWRWDPFLQLINAGFWELPPDVVPNFQEVEANVLGIDDQEVVVSVG
jgi:hypothetical protein